MTMRRDDADHRGLTLTSRELAILCLIAAGLTNSEAARRLHISRHTVAQHIAEMLRRMQARNRAELVARAYTSGTLSITHWPPSGKVATEVRDQATDLRDGATALFSGIRQPELMKISA